MRLFKLQLVSHLVIFSPLVLDMRGELLKKKSKQNHFAGIEDRLNRCSIREQAQKTVVEKQVHWIRDIEAMVLCKFDLADMWKTLALKKKQ